MGLPRGLTIPLSPARRVLCDMLHASRGVPLVAMERRLHLNDVVRARRALADRPSWFAVFLKAYGLVSQHRAPVRQSYQSFPWARLHQHACSVGHVVIARRIAAEDVVLGLLVRHPERKPLRDLDQLIRRARTEPVAKFAQFRRALHWPGSRPWCGDS